MKNKNNLQAGKLTKGTATLFGTILLTLVLMIGATGQVFADATVTGLNINNTNGAYIENAPIQPAGLTTDITATPITEEPARYNLATAQGADDLRTTPGGKTEGIIRFYNVDGNRTTQIALEVTQAPDNWVVEIVTETLNVEPTELLTEPVKDVPDGTVYLAVGNRGYALARIVAITVHVPETEEAGTTEVIRITAVATWLNQIGEVTIRQTRDFNFKVTVA